MDWSKLIYVFLALPKTKPDFDQISKIVEASALRTLTLFTPFVSNRWVHYAVCNVRSMENECNI